MRHLFSALLAVLTLGLPPLGGVASAGRPPAGRYWRAKSASVRLSKPVRAKLDAIAARYHAKTHRRLVVTSGTRSPREQALAMYRKLRAGSRLRIYRDKAAVRPLRAVYDKGRRARWSRARIIAQMAAIIAAQCERGTYLSRHLRAHAFDLRSRGLSRRHKRALIAAVRHVGGVTIVEERRPPHFHLELRPTRPK